MKIKYFKLLFFLLIFQGTGFTYAGKLIQPVRDTIHVIGHAHMDMNWKWTYPETVKMCIDNLRQTVAFMEEFPDFTMIQSQAAIYNIIEKYDPCLFEKVAKYVREGRLEIAGGMWTEGDMNLSSGEAISRSFLLGQGFFLDRFGKTAKIGWLPDNFGHVSQLPQILKLSDCDYLYFSRCKPHMGTFWCKGPDSSRVLCYSNNGYNGKITPDLRDEINRITPDKRRILQITGVGDHGGGPTRAEIKMVHELDRTRGYPAVKFTRAEDFFRQSAIDMDGRPTHRGEMQFIFEGCYTTVADIKEGNRNSEDGLYSAELLSSLRWLKGEQYPGEEMNKLWEKVVYNQFHDILPGSCIHEVSRDAITDYRHVIAGAMDIRDDAFRKMADEIRVRTDLGQPVIAFNQQPFSRKAIIEAEIYTHEKPFTANLNRYGLYYESDYITPVDQGQGPFASVLVSDGQGNACPGQITWGKTFPPGYRFRVFFIADMPAMGYKSFYIDSKQPGTLNKSLRIGENLFETDFFRIRVDMNTGEIISLFDKRTQIEYAGDDGLHKHRIFFEKSPKVATIRGTSAWTIGSIIKVEDVTNIQQVRVTEEGPVRACIEAVKFWGRSKIIQRTYIYKSYPRIDYNLEVHWFEQGDTENPSPMLRAIFPSSLQDIRFYCQVPFDVVERPDGKKPLKTPLWYNENEDHSDNIPDGQEVPAQRWVDISNDIAGIALLNRTKHGHSFKDGELRLTLLRSPGFPDQYPNLGKFHIQYALYPHSGDWRNDVWQEGDVYNIPVYASEPPSLSLGQDKAFRAEEDSFISLKGRGVFLSGIKKAEKTDELIIRLVETFGDKTTAILTLPANVVKVRKLDLIEKPVEEERQPEYENNTIHVTVKPHEIVTLGITLNRDNK